MLVLTRKYQEKIRIGENITITVLRMKGKAVRLGIEAPDSVPVVRGELAFNVEADAAKGEAPTVEVEAVVGSSSARGGRSVARAAGMTTHWTTESKPDAGRGLVGESAPKVGFTRVSRDKVADLLPKLASGTAPLRAIMDRR